MGKQKGKDVPGDVLVQTKDDRRTLPNVPDEENIRTNIDRRGQLLLDSADGSYVDYIKMQKAGIRYLPARGKLSSVDVSIKKPGRGARRLRCECADISDTGLLFCSRKPQDTEALAAAEHVQLRLKIPAGMMPEGYEGTVRIGARVVRSFEAETGRRVFFGLVFDEPLSQHLAKRKDRYNLTTASILLFAIILFIMMMRAESILYFQFNKVLYLYSIIAACFLLTRYLFASFYRVVPVDANFTPGVSIIIPCFNEEEWIRRTILSCVNQDYPIDRLEVILVDDCSTDASFEVALKTVADMARENPRYRIEQRVRCVKQPQNKGKRDALARGAQLAVHDLLVFVDSDSFLDPFAIRNLVQPFKDPKMGGVSGRTDVANTFTNALTKMQSVRYYIAFRVMKAAEARFDAVTCLSGPLACYRKDLVLRYLDDWINQKFLGQRATFGDDRSMTNFILRHHRTGYQDSAICHTVVPNKHANFLKQQMRWKRSWLRESIIASGFMWRKEPFMAVSFYMGLVIPIAAPVVVLYNLVYVPLTQHIFPTTFLTGLLLMSLLMSAAQLLLRKSSTWLYGLLFCIYYEAVLLWQMPVAWFTFWKSTWGTRMTPEDVKEQEQLDREEAEARARKEARRQARRRRRGGANHAGPPADAAHTEGGKLN